MCVFWSEVRQRGDWGGGGSKVLWRRNPKALTFNLGALQLALLVLPGASSLDRTRQAEQRRRPDPPPQHTHTTVLILVMEHALLVARCGSKGKPDICLSLSFFSASPNPSPYYPHPSREKKQKPTPIPMACLGGEGMNCPELQGPSPGRESSQVQSCVGNSASSQPR